MKFFLVTFLGISLLTICLAACGWQPKVTAVQITEPWSSMNLPIKENAIVWKSLENEFRAVHKEDKQTILKNYTEALKAQGWELGDFREESGRYLVDMKKGIEAIHLEFYDFDNTGVVIKKE